MLAVGMVLGNCHCLEFSAPKKNHSMWEAPAAERRVVQCNWHPAKQSCWQSGFNCYLLVKLITYNMFLYINICDRSVRRIKAHVLKMAWDGSAPLPLWFVSCCCCHTGSLLPWTLEVLFPNGLCSPCSFIWNTFPDSLVHSSLLRCHLPIQTYAYPNSHVLNCSPAFWACLTLC